MAPILIVGAGQAGVQIADSLRQEGYTGDLLLIGNESHPPYQRPPLSKKWLLEPGAHSALALRGAEALLRRRIELKLDTEVTAIERTASQLRFANGERLAYSKLALATGAWARVLPLPGAALGQVLSLRSIADSAAISAAIRRCAAEGRPVVVIGGGFIGLEVAASARKLGAAVTVLEGLPRLMSRVTAPISLGGLRACASRAWGGAGIRRAGDAAARQCRQRRGGMHRRWPGICGRLCRGWNWSGTG